MAVLIPSLLPPPAPFKIFVLLAGVAGISVPQFALAIAIGRGIRYFAEGLLAVWYGDRAMEFIARTGGRSPWRSSTLAGDWPGGLPAAQARAGKTPVN